ncbi:hypothetical protein [Alloalcanivorax venustensis]|uniref:hypothetical protein n=1 Tax=Alloalcanivorax venustensis TaxID=172371 RepID=UPI0039C39ACF
MDDLSWDENAGSILYVDNVPVDMDSPISIGDEVRLQHGGYEFDVIVEEDENGELGGIVTRIGPEPSTEAEGVCRGDYVSFHEGNVFQATRS